MQIVSITAETSAMPVTKTQVSDKVYDDGGAGILWSVRDAIGVFGTSTVNSKFVSNNAVPSMKATFSGGLIVNDSPAYAYSPYRDDATNYRAIPATISSVQKYSDASSIGPNDIRAVTEMKVFEGVHSFKFTPMYSLLRIQLNADDFSGFSDTEELFSITISEAEDSEVKGEGFTGNYTMNLMDSAPALSPVSGEVFTSLTIQMEKETLLKDKPVIYAIVAPTFRQGQKLDVLIETDESVISFNLSTLLDFEPNYCYDVPINLSKATDDNNLVITKRLMLKTFSFDVNCNEGKILGTEAYFDAGSSTTTTRSVAGISTEIEYSPGGGGTIDHCIPYLYDFNLVPTFTTTSDVTVWVGDEQQTSGVSSQNFSSPVTYTLKSTTDETLSCQYVVTLTNTGLPVVVLNSELGSVNFLHTKVPAKSSSFSKTDQITIYNGGAVVLETTNCGYRLRGNSTQKFPKKPFAIKLTEKKEVLGMPAHNRWCLLANWMDRTYIRNAVAFAAAEKADKLSWNPSGKNVELVLNGCHIGNYFLCEQIKIDENRLAIKPPYKDVTSPTIADCGYLMELDTYYDEKDKFMTDTRQLPVMFKDDFDDNGTAIFDAIKTEFNTIEQYLIDGLYKEACVHLDINSVIDWWLVQELMMNNEFKHPKSSYMYKDGDGKIFAGPVWDFDWQTLPNIANVNASSIMSYNGSKKISYSYDDLLYSLNSNTYKYLWYPLLFNEYTFVSLVKARWKNLYSAFSSLENVITELGKANAVSDIYNSAMWPIDSQTGLHKTAGSNAEYSGDEDMTYEDAITNMVKMLHKRLAGMNTSINALVVPDTWGIVGDVNNWGTNVSDVQMTYDATAKMYVAKNVVMPKLAAAEDGTVPYPSFRIRKNETDGNATSYGLAAAATVEAGNYYALVKKGNKAVDISIVPGEYDIWFDLTNSKVYIMAPGADYSSAKDGSAAGDVSDEITSSL